MILSAGLPAFLVTLREGVEAALVVGIVLACLNKAQQSYLNRWVYGGIGAGLLGSALIGIILNTTVTQVQQGLPGLEALIEPTFDCLFGAIAIIMLSWMLVWMTRQASSLKSNIEGTLSAALTDAAGAEWTLFSLVCIAVLREGIETVLFIFTSVQQTGAALVGAIGGLTGATLIGLALFKWGIRINLRRFFQVMGVLLLLIIGGLVISFFHHLDEVVYALGNLAPAADLCISQQSCLLGPLVWDAHGVLPDKGFPGILLKTLLGYRDRMYAGQLLAYGLFLAIVGGSYFRSLTPPRLNTPESSVS
jgi:high-affinity iron transporter